MAVKKVMNQNKATWYYDFRISGVRYRGAIPEARNQEQAKQAEHIVRTEVYEGRYGLIRKSRTVKDFMDNVYLPWSRTAKRSWRNDESRSKAIVNFFGNRKLNEITPFLVEKFKLDRKASLTPAKRLRSKASVNRELQLLSRIFSLAISKKEAQVNPCKEVKLLKGEGRRNRYLVDDEETRLLNALTGGREYLRPIVVLAINTGMRRGNVLSLQWEHVDFNRSVIHVTQTKTDDDYDVPMNQQVRQTLLRQKERSKSKYVFPNPSTGLPWRDVKRAFAAACKEAKIEGLRFHDLRHSAGTRMADAGVPLPAVAAVLGHKDIKTTSRYAHATEEAKRRAVSAIELASHAAWSKNGQEKESAAG